MRLTKYHGLSLALVIASLIAISNANDNVKNSHWPKFKYAAPPTCLFVPWPQCRHHSEQDSPRRHRLKQRWHLPSSQTEISQNKKRPMIQLRNGDDDHSNNNLDSNLFRRNWDSTTKRTIAMNRSTFLSSSASLCSSIFASLLLTTPNAANAACLSGDYRKECIGVYKLPLDDAVLPYIETPEALKRYAPDLEWVPPLSYPSTYSKAYAQLQQQKEQISLVQSLISKGDLVEGGQVLLEIITTTTLAGRVIVREISNKAQLEKRNDDRNDDNVAQSDTPSNIPANVTKTSTALEMKAYRIEYNLYEALGYMGETDVMIGQGLRGELGVSAPAQLLILDSLRDVEREMNELIRAIPESVAF